MFFGSGSDRSLGRLQKQQRHRARYDSLRNPINESTSRDRADSPDSQKKKSPRLSNIENRNNDTRIPRLPSVGQGEDSQAKVSRPSTTNTSPRTLHHDLSTTSETLDFMQHSLLPPKDPNWKPTSSLPISEYSLYPSRSPQRKAVPAVTREIEQPITPSSSAARSRASSLTASITRFGGKKTSVNAERLQKPVPALPRESIDAEVPPKPRNIAKQVSSSQQAQVATRPIRRENGGLTEISQKPTLRSPGSAELLRAVQYAKPSEHVSNASKGSRKRAESTNRMAESVHVSREESGSTKGKVEQMTTGTTLAIRKDSLVEMSSPERRNFHSKGCSRDTGSSLRTRSAPSTRLPTPVMTQTSSSYKKPDNAKALESQALTDSDGLLEAICKIDKRCFKQAERYVSLGRQRVELQDSIVSSLSTLDKSSVGVMHDRHHQLAMINIDMDRQVAAILEDQRQKTAWVRTLIEWNQAETGSGADGKERGSSRFTMSYDSVMNFLDTHDD